MNVKPRRSAIEKHTGHTLRFTLPQSITSVEGEMNCSCARTHSIIAWGYTARISRSHEGMDASSNGATTVSSAMAAFMARSSMSAAKTSIPASAYALANEPPIRPSPTMPTRLGVRSVSDMAAYHSAVTAERMMPTRRIMSSNCSGRSAWAPSEAAWAGS